MAEDDVLNEFERDLPPEGTVSDAGVVIPPGTTLDTVLDAYCDQAKAQLPMYLTSLSETKRKFILTLLRKAGNITNACRAVGISRITYYNWRKADKDFAMAVWEVGQALVDNVESKLMENINAGLETSILFFLRCKGKARGYVERKEIVVNPAGEELPPVPCQIDLDNLSKEEVLDLRALIAKGEQKQIAVEHTGTNG